MDRIILISLYILKHLNTFPLPNLTVGVAAPDQPQVHLWRDFYLAGAYSLIVTLRASKRLQQVAKALICQATNYIIINDTLYKWGFNFPYLRCLHPKEWQTVSSLDFRKGCIPFKSY